MTDLDEYLRDLDDASRVAFERVRDIAAEVAPKAQQGTSYGMAALKLGKKPLLGFLAAKGHLSIFPFSPQVVDAVRDRLTGFDLSKGTIRFTAERPLPDDVVVDIVRLRAEEITGSAG